MRSCWPGIRLWRQEHAHEEHEADGAKDDDTSWRGVLIWWTDPERAIRYSPAQAEYALLETRSLGPRDMMSEAKQYDRSHEESTG